MHFYSHLITIFFPFVILNNNDDLPPTGFEYVIDYQNRQVVTYNNDKVIATEV